MIWLLIHLITWVVIAVLVALTIFTNSNTKIYQMITRLGYLVSIASGIMLLGYAWQRDPMLTAIKLIVAIIFIGLTEMTFARKNRKQLNKSVIYAVGICCIGVGVLGLMLAGGRPFI
ncbi:MULTISPECIES: DUF1516 family protein [Dellaglioa]|uniref:DUF1516 family protein n=3 Tax=Dellaglioa TaxID=2767880 RepID=A0A0R1HGV0_9LACO|nr:MULTISPECIES: DUF1516 family protein [Dellaglioa]KRK45606.1 hypothetical protein FC66_GL001255 [Dellaglioa algida DSM 15638]MCZ2491968.1 YisL family protein [Dellaglioa carnosa]MCZ2494999.1 YisL family protein [Dellaglioa carnosa]MDK1717383.1 YisL family protein [Dellaglioa algida]MDK1719059.1 YisL family protein [Dellaglioa algida]